MLRVSGQHFDDMSCVTSSRVFLLGSNFNLFLSGMEGEDGSKESTDPHYVRIIEISRYQSSTTTSRRRPVRVNHTMVEHVYLLISKKNYLRMLPTPDGKIIAFSTHISSPEPSTTTGSVSDAPSVVDFELYHP
ncbi:eukaryotic translation initiation factor 3subunit 7 [Striga asiatica]|uniref:Eukaryotic translation initiation factor 3subunit 7 n=1 Tax=Striga asiatica TaxID=4170 RepID=A0A5A7RCS1_STRAF|nr:eukaryotic translation initiation factor 3subunit 7 [Striga asiatica]